MEVMIEILVGFTSTWTFIIAPTWITKNNNWSHNAHEKAN